MSEEKKDEIVPLVSVCVITYNHEKYIRQCLDGILMQKVNFPYEILIHDDASPDATADIIREYEAKYPDVIKPIYQTENQYSKVGIGAISRFNDERARGKYIAQCEGDDYWTDPGKLQMQVDFLEAHPEYVGTAHNVRVVDENGEITNKLLSYPRFDKYIFTFHDVEYFRLAGQTASLVYRNIFSVLPLEIKEAYYKLSGTGDRKLILLLTLHGNMYCFDEVMSSYRSVLTGTSWSARTRGIYSGINITSNIIDHHKFVEKYYSRQYNVYEYLIYLCFISFLRIGKYHTYSNIIDFKKIVFICISDKQTLQHMLREMLSKPFGFIQIIWINGI